MRFTFGIICYNQEKYILELLESIKYQIETYGQNVGCFLFVSDDCSGDKTVELAKKWLDKNGHLFISYDVFVSEHNKGTTSSYKTIISHIKTDFFKVIAGDDLFAAGDVFEDLKKGRSNLLIAHMPLMIKGDTVKLDKYLLSHNLVLGNKKRNNTFDVKQFRLGGYVSTPGFFPAREYIDNRCIDFMRQFTVFEDDPTWYMILKNNPNVVIEFDTKVKVLYRIHEGAVSNSCSVSGKWFKDYVKLKNYYLTETKDIFSHFVIKMQILDMENLYKNGRASKVSLLKVHNWINRMITKKKAKRYLTVNMLAQKKKETSDNQKYYDMISHRAAVWLQEK